MLSGDMHSPLQGNFQSNIAATRLEWFVVTLKKHFCGVPLLVFPFTENSVKGKTLFKHMLRPYKYPLQLSRKDIQSKALVNAAQ